MGCVSSKVLSRSGSFRDDLRLSLQRRTNGIPGLENLFASKSGGGGGGGGGGDHLIAILCTANTVAAKLKAGDAAHESGKQPPSHAVEPERGEKENVASTTTGEEPPETINTWELMAGLEQDDDDDDEGREEEPEQRPPPQPQREDLEAMVAANSSITVRRDVEAWLEKSHGNSSEDPPPERAEQKADGDDATANGNAADRPEDSGAGNKAEIGNVDSAAGSRSDGGRGPEGSDMAGNESFAPRRRARARELKTLKVPSFEFSSVGSLREWLEGGGQVFSPGSYSTPKFGTQAAAAAERRREADEVEEEEEEEGPLFDPELVAGFEEAMERLSMEEEHILQEIAERLQTELEEDGKGEKI